MYGLSADDALKLREAFASIGWSRRIGPGLKKISADLEPPLDTSQEKILFAVHPDSSDHIRDVRIDDINLSHNHVEAIGTDCRIIFLDTDKMGYYAYPCEDLASVDMPTSGGVLKEINYSQSKIIQAYKAAVTHWCRDNGHPEFAWQSRFYDRILRDEAALQRVRQYNVNNPLKDLQLML